MRTIVLVCIAAACVVLGISAVATAASLRASFGDGTYRVGKDVRPGTYRARGGEGCYWARLKNFSGSLGAILANENASGPTLVTILRRDRGFETQGCGSWTRDLHRITKSKTRFGTGKFIVRTDITPGTYRSRGGGSCYWARLRAFTGSLGAIIANDNPTGSTIVTI